MSNIPDNIKNIIEEYTSEVTKLLGKHLKQIILYGSYARGDFNENSDIDIMILTNLTDDEIIKYRSEIAHLTYDVECNNNFEFSLSPLLKNIDKFNYWLEALPFYMNVQKEGVVLNGK